MTAIIKGIQELSRAVADCVNEFKQSIEVDTRLNAVIKATGQQYKYTTRDIKEYASALQEQTRFGDDVIEQSAQLLVATQKFSKEGLERTLELSADLAEAMGTDLTSATSTLSKALIEPGEGLNRLKTIGISFTDAEEDMIKKLREAGDELGAQQVILDKVEKAYGGVAESVGSIDTSTLDKISNVWGDLKEDLGSVFTTVLGPVFDWIYKTLSRLERFANKIKNDVDFNKAMVEGDYTTLANNFDTDFLTGKLNEVSKDYNRAVKELSGEYFNEMSLINERYGLTIEDFIDQSFEEQQRILTELFGDSPRILGILEEADFGYQFSTITKALELQRQQEEEWNKQLIQAQNAALIKAAGGLSGIFKSATDSALTGFFSDNPITVDGITGVSIGNTMLKGYWGTGVSDSTYMSTMFGDIGMWAQTTQSFMETFYEWESDFDEWVRKYGEPDRTSGAGFNFGISSGDFGLTNSSLDFSSTMSLLGPNGVKNLGFDSKTIYDGLTQYGGLSKTLKIDNLTEEIERLTTLQESTEGQMSVYYQEMIDGLDDQLKELTKIEKDQRTFLDKMGEKVGTAVGSLFGADEDQSKAAGSAIINSFTSQMGEAGEVVSRLATNMATMGPLLGAIVTALHYVIGGLMETLQEVFNDFIAWGIEPLKEFGRMIGQILLPIFEEIMPSVVATGKVLMNLFQAIGRLLAPIVEILMRVIGPVLTVLADILVSIVGTISWAIDWIAYCITWVLNKVSFGWIDQSANPGSLSSYVEGMYSNPAESYSATGANSVGTTNASYSGGTVVHLTVINNGNVCGDAGILEFATMIKNELADAQYLGR